MRWLLVPLGLAIVASAGWLLMSSPEDAPPDGGAARAPARAAVSASPAPRRAPAPEPHAPRGDIDEASRRALERILEREGLDP